MPVVADWSVVVPAEVEAAEVEANEKGLGRGGTPASTDSKNKVMSLPKL